jgi:hypothetical protein
MIAISGLLILAFFLSGCQVPFGDEDTPIAIGIPQETTSPTETETVAPSPTLTVAAATATVTMSPTNTRPPVIQRIQFAPGVTSDTREGTLAAGQQHKYIFRALSGQTARVELGSTDDSANFSLLPMDSSPPYKPLDDPAHDWQGVLPHAQEYMITVTAPQATTYRLTLTIDPLSQPDLPVILDPGSPPSDRCVVVHPGGTAVVTVYLGPSTAFAPIARLGNFAVVLSSENGWHQIQVGPGHMGWIRETDVGFAGPCDHVNEVVRFEVQTYGSPVRTNSTILPGQAHRYVFGAEAGNRLLIDLNSTGQVNFALLGVDDGQPLKRIANEDRTWEGILPGTQDYMLTVVPGNEAVDYELLVALVAAPPLAVIFDAHSDAILGGFQDAVWVDGSTAASFLLGGEKYGVYHLGQRLSQASGSAAVPTGIICPGHTVHLTPAPAHPSALAEAGATWEVALRPVAPVQLSEVERQVTADLLASEGLAISATELLLQEAFSTDLDGNGTGEIIVLASRLKGDGSTPAVDAGDYAVVAVLMEIDGQLHAEPLILNVYRQANDLAYPWRYELSGALDLNGDGNLEVVLAGTRWEGTSTTVYSVGIAGGAAPVLEWNCAE